MRIRTAIPTMVTLLLVACSSNAQNLQVVTLPSGKQIRVIAVGPLRFTNGSPPALMMKYETDLKISDKKALRQEVDEIWNSFRNDAENGKYGSAIISAQEVSSGGFIKKSSGYNFVFERSADGTWRCLEDSKK